MEHFSLVELYGIRKRLIKENYKDEELVNLVNDTIERKEKTILEDTSATGGLSVGSSGNVSAQPSGLAGATIGTNWSSHGGTEGGYISTPYNPSGANRVFQKDRLPMGKDHGPRTGKKSRTKKLDIKTLKNMLSKTQDYQDGQGERTPNKPENQASSKDKRVLDFNDFLKNDFNTIKK